MNNTESTGDESEPSTDVPPTIPASLERFIRVGAVKPEPDTTAEPAASAGSASGAESTTSPADADNDNKIPRNTNVKDYSLQLAKAAARVAIENNGTEVMVLDVCDQTALFDYFVLATGTSRRQLHAISEQIDDVLQKEMGDQRVGIEGYEDSRWIVLDYGSVVIHLFDEETRSYYDLESLWADATVVPLADLGLSDSGASSHSDN
jgi:ribosome-associated protein